MSTTAATVKASIVASGHLKFAASSLTTTTEVVLKPASSGRVALLTESIHSLRRAAGGLSFLLAHIFLPRSRCRLRTALTAGLFPLPDAPQAFGVYVAANMTYPRDEVVSGAEPGERNRILVRGPNLTRRLRIIAGSCNYAVGEELPDHPWPRMSADRGGTTSRPPPP
jgi:hypothetical protein